MSNYDLREQLERIGFDHKVGSQPIDDVDWKVVESTPDEVALKHEEGGRILIRQKKPVGGDLPFRAIREGEGDKNLQLAEGDWADKVITPAIAYMRGFSDNDCE